MSGDPGNRGARLLAANGLSLRALSKLLAKRGVKVSAQAIGRWRDSSAIPSLETREALEAPPIGVPAAAWDEMPTSAHPSRADDRAQDRGSTNDRVAFFNRVDNELQERVLAAATDWRTTRDDGEFNDQVFFAAIDWHTARLEALGRRLEVALARWPQARALAVALLEDEDDDGSTRGD